MGEGWVNEWRCPGKDEKVNAICIWQPWAAVVVACKTRKKTENTSFQPSIPTRRHLLLAIYEGY
jgi:hypothetical protein